MTPRHSHIAFFAILAILLSGCGPKTAKTDEPTAMPAVTAPAAESTSQPQRPTAESPTPKAFVASVPMAQPGPAPVPPTAQDFSAEPALKDVLFGSGRTDIDSNGARVIRSNARWMIDNQEYLILVEDLTTRPPNSSFDAGSRGKMTPSG